MLFRYDLLALINLEVGPGTIYVPRNGRVPSLYALWIADALDSTLPKIAVAIYCPLSSLQ